MAVAFVAVSSGAAFLTGCRNDATPAGPTAEQTEGAANPGARAIESIEATSEGGAHPEDDGGWSARSLAVALDEARRDAGAMDVVCEGVSLSLLGAAIDERCATSERDYKLLTRDGGVSRETEARLRQVARREGDKIVFSLVNRSKAPSVVPLRFHPGRSNLAFSIIAEDAQHAVFELAPPLLDLDASRGADAGTSLTFVGVGRRQAPPVARDGGTFERVHTARIRLPPDGTANVHITIDTRVVTRLHPPCGDASNCAPVRLRKGRYALYVGQLLAEIDTGPPARLEWDVP